MDVRLLGSFELRRDGETVALGGRRQRAVLAILALAANQPVSMEALVDRLWAGTPPGGAVGTLQAYVSNLRRLLEPHRAPRSVAEVLTSTANGYRLVIPDDARDIDRFASGTLAARSALAAGDPLRAAHLTERALAEWRGPALADFVDEPFAAEEILRLEEARLQAIELRFEAQLAGGRHEDVVAELRSVVRAHPLRERLRGQLMLALYRCGRQAEALEVARVGRVQLAGELGIDPDPANQRLEEAILRQDEALAAPVAMTPAVPPATTTMSATAPQRPDGPGPEGLVGRSEEREVLGRALAAVGRGTTRVVLIGGEPGIGKTRLAETFAGGIAEARVLWGRCHETEGAPPFWPWRQVLRTLTADLDTSMVRATLGADVGVVLDVAPELAEKVGAVSPARPTDADTGRFQFFDAVSRLLAAASRGQPLVVVLEDIHWADPPSMALLRFVVGTVRNSALLVVATYRDVAVAGRSLLAGTLGALAREPVVERLLLPGLTSDEGATLVGALLGQVPDAALLDALLERTGGNPLFIVHLARMLDGALEATTAQARDAILSQVPPAVVDLIGLRVAEQPEATRRLLEVAAVIGRRFDLDLVVEVEAWSFDEAFTAIQPAVAAGLVVEDEIPGTYHFTHALMREAIAAGLGRTRMGRLHGRVGDAMAVRGDGERWLPTLAHHYWEAARLGWATQALSTATAAATAAIAGLAFEEAMRHLDRALALLDGAPAGEARDRAEIDVRMQLARHHLQTRGHAVDEVGSAYARVRELAARTTAPSEFLIASWGLAAHHLVRSEHRAAIAIASELLVAGERDDDVVALLAGHQTTGVPSFYMGRPAEARHHLRRTLELVQVLPPAVLARFPQDVELGAMGFLALARWLEGDEAEAERLRADAVDRATRSGGYDEMFIRMVSAQLGVLRRSVAQVLVDTTRVLEVCGPVGFRHVAAFTRVLGGWARAMDGDPMTGLRSIEEGTAYFAAHERGSHRTVNLTLHAEALGLAGRADDAAAVIATAMTELDATEERFYEPETWMVAVRLRPDDPRVPTWLERAVAAAEATGAVPLRERAMRLATAHLGDGDAADGPAPERGTAAVF